MTAPLQIHRKSFPRHARSGFTLIELLVVIGVILVLVGIATVSFTRLDQSDKVTRTNMENLKAMVTEFESAGGVLPSRSQPVPAPDLNANNDGDAILNRWDAQDTSNIAVHMTKQVMASILRSTGAAAAYAKLPPKALFQIPNPAPGNRDEYLDNALADGWGHPILYVPSVGMSGITAGGATAVRRSPDGRPFFISAGPDGSFVDGDDNVYSFE